MFRDLVEDALQLRISLKSKEEIDSAVLAFTRVVQDSCWRSSEGVAQKKTRRLSVPHEIQDMILEKRRLRRVWHNSRHPDDKTALNIYAKHLKQAIKENLDATIEENLMSLTATTDTDYSLWKACKNLNQPANPKPPIRLDRNKWARSKLEKANAFANHLAKVFVPNEATPGSDEAEIDDILQQDFQLHLPLKIVTPREVQ
ncbi:unnamed protein product [Pieris macdunnoughi]|uniref:Uncharacterized protein n=1 Tax=Pieris macdunnoughi TaxID=345717 RepID=A0A821US22_9NEOP|nr:unnamed protein product [Pieris macdunnoughi]